MRSYGRCSQDLTRWGLPLMTEERPDDAVRSHWLAWALEQMLVDLRPDGSAVTIQILTGDQPIVVETGDGDDPTRLGRADDADATLTGQPRPILGFGCTDHEISGAFTQT